MLYGDGLDASYIFVFPLDVDDCAQQIVEGLNSKARETAVSEPKEMVK